MSLAFLNQPLDPVDLWPVETATFLKPNRVDPELSSIGFTLDVNMRWLIAITRVEEESVRAGAQNCRHRRALLCPCQPSCYFIAETVLNV